MGCYINQASSTCTEVEGERRMAKLKQGGYIQKRGHYLHQPCHVSTVPLATGCQACSQFLANTALEAFYHLLLAVYAVFLKMAALDQLPGCKPRQ